MNPIIEIKHVGKKYQITHQRGGYVALRDIITDAFRHPIIFLKQKTKEIVGKNTKEDFWALKDISLTINTGDVVGIIGHNGAGKSTLLKILTQITPPTEGEIIMRGKVASLLEVGTGFHPELTGRENIFLNGAILGMGKKEIAAKFDEIVTFAGIEKFLDTPVKYYSSGMYVRLAFSVAAHMEPDILLVDEVLAVGDAEFQKKCLGKMEEVTKKNGRTIFLVSHNMAAIQSLCNKTILLKNGRIEKWGDTKEVIDAYMSSKRNSASDLADELQVESKFNSYGIQLTNLAVTDTDGHTLIQSDRGLKIALSYTSTETEDLQDIRMLVTIISQRSRRIDFRLDSYGSFTTFKDHTLRPNGIIECETGVTNLVEGRYDIEVALYPQRIPGGFVRTTASFGVETNNQAYDFRVNPDITVCDHLISANFIQHQQSS